MSCEASGCSPVVMSQCQQTVAVRAAGGAHGQMYGDPREPVGGVVSPQLGLDVALKQRARSAAACVARIELEGGVDGEAAAVTAR
jgi:hypothetical protein